MRYSHSWTDLTWVLVTRWTSRTSQVHGPSRTVISTRKHAPTVASVCDSFQESAISFRPLIRQGFLLWTAVYFLLHGIPWTAKDNLLWQDLPHGLHMNLCSRTLPTLPPSLTLMTASVVSLSFFSLFSLTTALQNLLHFLKYAITEVIPVVLLWAAVGPFRIWLEPATLT